MNERKARLRKVDHEKLINDYFALKDKHFRTLGFVGHICASLGLPLTFTDAQVIEQCELIKLRLDAKDESA